MPAQSFGRRDTSGGRGVSRPAKGPCDSSRSGGSFARTRDLLLNGVAASAVLLGMGGAALAADPCTGTTTVTCSGDQHPGIAVTDPTSLLNVLNLSDSISPASGVDGISFDGTGSIEMNVDLGDQQVSTTGDGADAISAKSWGGSGTVKVDVQGALTSADGYGIYAEAPGKITEISSGTIDSGLDGIHLHGTESAAISIDHTGKIVSTSGGGIFADTSGSISEKSNGEIDVVGDGIHLESYGDAVGLDHTGAITSTAGDGVYASGLGDVTSTTSGAISAAGDGIHVEGHGLATDTITVKQTGAVISTGGDGVYAWARGKVGVTVKGDITAAGEGIVAVSTDSTEDGAVSIDNTGTITANGGDGIDAHAALGQVAVAATGNINAQGNGVNALSDSGNVAVTQTGDISATGGSGLLLAAPAGSISLDGSGTVTATGDAISAVSTGGGGSILIDRSGDVTSTGGRGIYATGLDTISVTNDGAINASEEGIFASSQGGSTAVTVTQTGDVTSSNGQGIHAESATGPVTVTSTGTVNAATDGVWLSSTGAAAVSLTEIGAVDAASGYGLYAYSADGSVTINTSGGAVHSALDAVHAETGGVSDVKVVVNASLTSDSGDGIFASTAAGGKLSVAMTGDINAANGYGIYGVAGDTITETSSGKINSGLDGIHLQGTAYNSIGINHTGDITATGGAGIFADTSGAIADLSSGTINSADDGIHLQSHGSSLVSLNHTGDITSTGGDGVYAWSLADVTSTTNGAISAHNDAIHVESRDAGKISIDQTGNLTSTNGMGVYAWGQGDITSTTSGTISTADDGIHLESHGSGAINLTQTGAVTSTGGSGIYARGTYGPLTITMTGDISAANGYGIYGEAGGNISETSSGTINSGQDGIHLQGTADGTIGIDQTGDITSTGGAGIFADGMGAITEISTGTITAAGDGIHLKDRTDSSVSLDHTGTITSTGGYGVYAWSLGGVASTTNGAISSHDDAIHVESRDYGAISIGQTGDLTSTNGMGVYAWGQGDITTLTSGTIAAASDGIHAESLSGGAISVTQTGDVTSTNSDGIYARASQGPVTVVNNGNVNAGLDGLWLTTGGYSDINLTQVGTITAGTGYGIHAVSADGNVTVNATGDIHSGADGVFAQTTGDSNAGVAVTVAGNIVSDNGYGIYTSASRGPITVASSGDVNSITAANDGIFAESTGDTSPVSVTYSGDITSTAGMGVDASSSRGAVTVTTIGTIIAEGDGISAGNTSDDNAVTVNHTGNITSSTANGVFASASNAAVGVTTAGDISGAVSGISLQGYGTLTATVDSGTVTGGSSGGVNFHPGDHPDEHPGTYAYLYNYGTINNSNGIDGLAITADYLDTSIDNYGTVTGSVSLSAWSNSFYNYAGGLFETGAIVNLGDGSLLTNAGTLSPGGSGVIETTALTGKFVNTADGTLAVDADLQNKAIDELVVSNTADLSGNLAVHITSLSSTPQDLTFLTATGGLTTTDLNLEISPVVMASISYTGGTDANLSITGINFAPAGLSGNAASVGSYLNSLYAGSNTFDPIALGLANLGSLAAVNQALNELSPGSYLSSQQTSLVANNNFANELFSCHVADGANVFNAEGQCAWARADYGTFGGDASTSGAGYEGHTFGLTAGGQVAVSNDVRVDTGLGYSRGSQTDSYGGSDDVQSIKAGVAVKYLPGPYLFAASLTGTYGWHDVTRHVDFGGFTDTLTSSPDTATLNARLRAAYTMQSGAFYARPMLDLNAGIVHTGAFTETGGLASLNVGDSTNAAFNVNPALEVGGQFKLASGTVVRPYIRAGVVAGFGPNFSTSATLVNDTTGTSPFTTSTSQDSVQWTLSGGLDLLNQNGVNAQLFYDGTYGDAHSQSAGIKVTAHF